MSLEAAREAFSARRLAIAAAVLVTAAALSMAASADANHSGTDLISTGSTGGNGAFTAGYRGSSAAGTRVFFVTSEKLVSGDTDGSTDVYERRGGTTTLLSIGPNGGNGAFSAFFAGSSADGTRVFIETNEKLVSADTDSSQDVYERSGTTTTLVSAGVTGGNGAFNAFFDGASDDGTRVFFETGEQLTATDGDSSVDVYERSAGTTVQVSTGPGGGNGAFNALYDGNSADGSRVFLSTRDALVPGDTDGMLDVYERSGGATTQVSTGPSGGNGAFDTFYDGASADGTRVFLDTDEVLTADDTDSSFDVYQRSGGVTTRISAGAINGNGAFDVFFDGNSADGLRVFFESDEKLATGDTDNAFDIFERSTGTTTRVSAGAINGNGAFDAFYGGISDDGTKVFFESDEQLAASDSDSAQDVYQRSGGATTTQVSTGPSGGNGAQFAFFDGSSADGNRVFFDTDESLVSADTDTAQDVYERFSGATTRLTAGPAGGNGTDPAFFSGNSDDGTRVFYETGERLVSEDTDSSIDVYAARLAAVSPGYDVPASASPLHFSLVPEFRQTISSTQCTARGGLNSSHGPPLAFASCNPPGFQPGLQAHVGTAGRGSADLVVIDGDPATPADEADFAIVASLSDVRQGSALGADYVPSASGADVSLRARLRYNDTFNTTSGQPCGSSCPGTMIDFELSAPINCSATADPSVGSTCSVSTSADGVVPGMVRESRSSVVQTFRVRIHDAGPNATVGDSDDARMASQGIYIP